MPEVAATGIGLPLELDHLFPSSIRPGDSQRVHSGLGARVGQAHFFHSGAHGDDLFGYTDFQRVREGVDDAIMGRLAHPGIHLLVRVTQDDRAKAQPVVRVPVAVYVPQVGALAPLHDERLVVAPVAKVRVDAQRDYFCGSAPDSPALSDLSCH